jgi:hypothetical protein
MARKCAVETIKKLGMFDPQNHPEATKHARDFVEECVNVPLLTKFIAVARAAEDVLKPMRSELFEEQKNLDTALQSLRMEIPEL